jgi:hypothetical protein
MADMPVAAGMDMMEDSNFPYLISQGAQDLSADTGMRDTIQPAVDGPDLFDWDQDENGSGSSYPMSVDIGTSVPTHSGPIGTGEAAKGTPATASGSGGGLQQMNPQPYGES